MYDAPRHHPEDAVFDRSSGTILHRYDDEGLFDSATGVYREPFFSDEEDYGLDDAPEDYEGSTQIAGRWYLPKRRYRTAQGLRAELEAEGFNVRVQTGESGENVLCTAAAATST
jgi:hypothetical protein